MSPHKNIKNIFNFLLLSVCFGIVSLTQNVSASYLQYQTGDISVHPDFTDGVFYESVVDSYYAQKYKYEHNGSLDGYLRDESRWGEILTNEQLASIKTYNCSSNPQASKAAHITSFDGIELLTGIEDFSIDTCIVDTESLNLSSMPNLKSLLLYGGTSANLDVSKNAKLEKITILGYDFSNFNLSNNTKLKSLQITAGSLNPPALNLTLPNNSDLEELFLTGVNLAGSLNLKENDNIEELKITGSTPFDEIREASLSIVPSLSTRLKKTAGAGSTNDGWRNTEETFDLNLSALKFLRNSNTTVDGDIENETFAVIDTQCSAYDEISKTVIVRAFCVEQGLREIAVNHIYTINGTEYTNTFRIALNPVYVMTYIKIDDEPLTLDAQVISDELYVGQGFDTDKYLSDYAEEKGLTLIKVEVAALGGDGTSIALETFKTSTDIRKVGAISSDDTVLLNITYYYDSSSDAKTPNTGFFTNEDGSANVSNILLSLAGISVSAFVVLYLANRFAKKAKAKRF